MIKFIVVLYRRPDVSAERFHAILREEHGAMAEQLPGLRRYVQNHVSVDPTRKHPGWDAVVELYWDDWASMEAAWRSMRARRTWADRTVRFDFTPIKNSDVANSQR